MIAVPESKYDNIIHELNVIADSFDIKPFAFKLNRYKNEAIKIIQQDPEHAYIILGIIACIEDDLESMHKYHKNAITCSAESVHSLYQYSSSLTTQELMDEAYNYANKAYEKAPDEKIILDQLMHISYAIGKDYKYNELKEKMINLGFEFRDPNEFYEDNEEFLVKTISKVDALLERYPQMVVEPDPDFEDFVEDLVEGVDIS